MSIVATLAVMSRVSLAVIATKAAAEGGLVPMLSPGRNRHVADVAVFLLLQEDGQRPRLVVGPAVDAHFADTPRTVRAYRRQSFA